MNKKKLFAVVISLALVIAFVLPGTLAVSTDQTSSNGTIEVPTATTTPAPDTTETPAPEETEAPVETPTEEPAKTCTCDPKPAEGEAHKEGCPLYVAPEKPAVPSHIDTCSDDCADAECKCSCHLFNKIMACTTLDDIWAAFDEASDETVNALTDEQNAQIDAKIEALEPAPAPAVVIEESTEETVPSEIVYRTVNYTFVAPFGDPVTGGHR